MEKVRGFEIAKGFEDKGINLPIRKTKHAAGYDIEAAEARQVFHESLQQMQNMRPAARLYEKIRYLPYLFQGTRL